jgi:hypothetical protein
MMVAKKESSEKTVLAFFLAGLKVVLNREFRQSLFSSLFNLELLTVPCCRIDILAGERSPEMTMRKPISVFATTSAGRARDVKVDPITTSTSRW